MFYNIKNLLNKILYCIELKLEIMENISFVLWMLLYPFGCGVVSYLGSKRRAVENKEPYSDSTHGWAALINTCIWVLVGSILYVK